jgi:cytochrome c peroxidase
MTCRLDKPVVVRGLLGAVSALALLMSAPVGAQTFEEPPTEAPTTPDPANSVDASKVTVPPGSPSYLIHTYRAHLQAPLPAKIWRQGGIPKVINKNEQFANPHGQLGNLNVPGQTITANNAFFQSLGENGRSCVTCHNPPSGMGLSLKNIKARFRNNLNDPLFAPVDGANCPDQVPAELTSGALVGGRKGQSKRALRDAYSALLTKGLIRIPIAVPTGAEYAVSIVTDRPGCNTSPNTVFNRTSDGRPILSMYRRPIFSASLRFKSPASTDGNTSNNPPTNIMWDGREPSLRSQAISATLGHAQARPEFLNRADLQTLLDQIVDFETKFFSAQLVDKVARRLDANAFGGPLHLSTRSTVPPVGFPPPPAFDEYNNWAGLSGSAKADRQASIERGQAIFNGTAAGSTFTMANVGGFNDVIGLNPSPFPGSCALCHGFPHAGSELVFPPQRDIGTGGQASPASFDGPTAFPADPGVGPLPAGDLPVFKFTCTSNPHPFYGTEIITNDPGAALVTGKCADIGKKTVPALRGLASRAPFFSDGSAKDLRAVVDFYVKRFNMALTEQGKQDLVNFMAAL